MTDQTERERLLRLRAQMKRRRPKFRRENYYRLKRLQTSWRSPKGIDSKMRHKVRGKRKVVQTGYRSPKAVRGLHPSGKEVVRVFRPQDLEKVDPEIEIAQIGGSVGSRKRINIINEAEDLGIHIINPQVRRIDTFDDEEFVEIEDEFELLDDDDDLLLVDDEDFEDDEEFILDEELEEDIDEEAEFEAEMAALEGEADEAEDEDAEFEAEMAALEEEADDDEEETE